MPVEGLMLHTGLVPRLEAANCCAWEGFRVARFGLTLGDVVAEVFSVMVAWAVCAGFAVLATVRMIVCSADIDTGAVYTPFVIVPTDGASDQVTAVVGVPPMVTLN